MIESKRSTLLLGARWLVLVHVVALLVTGTDIGSLWLFLALVIYNAVLSVVWSWVIDQPRRRALVLCADLLIAVASVWLTGATWKSPYFIYAFTGLMMIGSYFSFKSSLAVTTCFCVAYTLVVFDGGFSTRLPVFLKDIDSFIGNYAAFFLTAVFFGYPSHVIREINEQDLQMAAIQQCLEPAQALAEAIKREQTLTARERQVLALVIEGMTNAQIAQELFITERTVKNHVYRMFKKLEVGSRVELLKIYGELRVR